MLEMALITGDSKNARMGEREEGALLHTSPAAAVLAVSRATSDPLKRQRDERRGEGWLVA